MARAPIFSFAGDNDYEESPDPFDEASAWVPPGQRGLNGAGFGSIAPVDDMGYLGGSKGFQEATDMPTGDMYKDVFGAAGSGGGGAVHNDYPAPAGAPAGGAAGGGLQADFSNALRTLINGPSAKEAGMDVLNSAPVKTFNANAKRGEARDRQFLAERAAARGYSGSGGAESGFLGLRARSNEAMDRFAGEQANVQEQGRREELMRALQMAMAFGDAESARAIQLELGRGSLDVQRHSINSSRDTALDNLGFGYFNAQNNLNQQLVNLFAGL